MVYQRVFQRIIFWLCCFPVIYLFDISLVSALILIISSINFGFNLLLFNKVESQIIVFKSFIFFYTNIEIQHKFPPDSTLDVPHKT